MVNNGTFLEVNLFNSIIGVSGGGIDNASAAVPSSSITLTNTLVANNEAATGPDYFGTVNFSDHNLIRIADGSSGFNAAGPNPDLLGSAANPLDPHLGQLGDNGGPTQTMALLPGSPAIDAGDNSVPSLAGSFDQRGQGFARVSGSTIDIGAFEVQQPPSPPPAPPPSPSPSPPPPSLFQALISLYIDGIEQEAFYESNFAGWYDNFDLGFALERVLQFFGNPSIDTIQASIAFNKQYAGPFGPYVVLAGGSALDQAFALPQALKSS